MKRSKSSSPPTEASFKIYVRTKLDRVPGLFYFVKEALALRGLADIYGCYNGKFFAWELKRSRQAAEWRRDGHELQKYYLEQVAKCGGIARVVHPENFDECLQELLSA